jgi:hypothetical protein
MSNHIFLSAIGDDDFNNKDEFIGNQEDRGETFEVRFTSDSKRLRRPNEAYITFAHPSTGEVTRSQVNSSNVKLFENCTGANSSK